MNINKRISKIKGKIQKLIKAFNELESKDNNYPVQKTINDSLVSLKASLKMIEIMERETPNSFDNITLSSFEKLVDDAIKQIKETTIPGLKEALLGEENKNKLFEKFDAREKRLKKIVEDNIALTTERDRMKTFLPELMANANWSAEELGTKLGLTRQSIKAIIKGKDISQAQYLALLFLFEGECINNNNEKLANLLHSLFNTPNIEVANKNIYETYNAIEKMDAALLAGEKDKILETMKPLLVMPDDATKIGFKAPMSTKPLGLGKKVK